ncbi:MAG: hypothetical protein Q9166_004249 [cf. Caloplaca sp. 2 TL-2023]
MDPLSVTASVIAVLALAKSTTRAFQDLRSLCKTLPGRLHALSNEVADTALVLNQVASVFQLRRNDPVLRNHALNIPGLMNSAASKFDELRSLILRLVHSCRSTRVPLLGAYAWRKDQPRLQALQEDIKNIKCNLNVMLGASNSLDLKAITAASSQSTQDQATFQEILQTDLVRHQDKFDESLTQACERIDQRIRAVERLLEAQSAQLEASQSNQLGNYYGPRYRQQPRRLVRRETQHPDISGSDSIAIRVNQYKSCRPGCACQCHLEKRSSTPGLVDRVPGQVFVGYTGLPGISLKCSVETCEKSQSPVMSFEYWFPLGFMWSQIVRLRLTYEHNLGPRFDLSTLRRVPDSAQCITFALNGNIDGLKDLFKRGLASPRDDSDFIDEQNYTLLHKIVLGLSMHDLEESLSLHPDLIDIPDAMGHAADRSYVTCVRLLLEAGADPDIAASYGYKVGNPLNVAARNASDPLVLKTLLDFGANVESCGIDGTTALIHAARKDNASFATLLLEYGANLNAVSTAGQTPLTTAVVFNSHNVLQLLLDRWFEYSECPRLKGPHLLQIVALYADIRTMVILTATDHLVISYDANYTLGDFASRLNERPDATEKLIQAFEDLLSVINRGPEMYRSPESLMESGLSSHGSPDRWTFSRTSTLGTDQDFVDAFETLQTKADTDGRGSCPVSPTIS